MNETEKKQAIAYLKERMAGMTGSTLERYRQIVTELQTIKEYGLKQVVCRKPWQKPGKKTKRFLSIVTPVGVVPAK